MAKKEHNPDDPEEFDREYYKLKMSAEHGIPFPEEENEGGYEVIPPETEEEFTDRMREWEEAMQNPDNTKIKELLGLVKFPKEQSLSEEEVDAALELLTTILAHKNIVLDVIYPTSPREIYRFMTEEFIHRSAGSAGIAGMTMHYIYEEFYPNHPEDIKSDATKVLSYLFGGSANYLPYCFASHVLLHGDDVPGEEFRTLLVTRRSLNKDLIFLGIENPSLDFDPPKAQLRATVRYGSPSAAGTTCEESTEAEMYFECEYGSYQITRLVIEKFGIE